MRNETNVVCDGSFPMRGGVLFLGLFLVYSVFGEGSLHAAQKPKEIPTFELAAIQLGDVGIPPLYYLEVKPGLDGKEQRTFKPLGVPPVSRGQTVEVSSAPTTQLYTGTFDAKGNPDMKPYLDIPGISPKDRLLLVFSLDRDGKTKSTFLVDSASSHPAGSVRFVNFGTDRMAFSVGGAATIVLPGADAKAMPVINSDGRFPFIQFLATPGEKTSQSPTKLLRFRSPGERLLVLCTTMQVEVETGQIDANGTKVTRKERMPMPYRLYDTVEAPASKTAEPAASTAKAAPPPAPQEQEIDIIAPGGQIPDGTEIEIAWDGQTKATKAVLHPDETVRVRAPLSAGATLRFAKGAALGQAAFGSASRQHLVIIVPGTDALEPMSVLAFENSVLSHPMGEARLFNLTPYPLAYALGKETDYITPRQAGMLPFASVESTVRLAVKTPAGWKMVSEVRPAKPDAGKRNAIFIYKLPGKDEFGLLEKAL